MIPSTLRFGAHAFSTVAGAMDRPTTTAPAPQTLDLQPTFARRA